MPPYFDEEGVTPVAIFFGGVKGPVGDIVNGGYSKIGCSANGIERTIYMKVGQLVLLSNFSPASDRLTTTLISLYKNQIN